MDQDEFDRMAQENSRRRARGEIGDHDRGGGQNDDDNLIVMIFVAILVAGAVMFAAGWLDAQFGWGLQQAIKDFLNL